DLAVACNEMVGKLDAALAAQRRFVADASHELRTPLAALGNGVEMLRLGVDRRDPAAREKLLRLMEGEIARMGRLVDDLLTLSALDRDPAHALQLGPVDLAALAAQVVDETRLLAPDRTVALDAPPGAPVVVRGDADRLRQALLNLCANARAHTPPGGAITVGVRRGGGGARPGPRRPAGSRDESRRRGAPPPGRRPRGPGEWRRLSSAPRRGRWAASSCR